MKNLISIVLFSLLMFSCTQEVKGKWGDISNWRKLEIGMSMDNVKNILGEPHKVNGGHFTYWYYHKKNRKHSYVRFDRKIGGQMSLGSWVEPDN